MAERLLSVEDLAQYLNVRKGWIYDNHRREGIPAHRVGRHLRFRLTEIDRWLDSRDA